MSDDDQGFTALPTMLVGVRGYPPSTAQMMLFPTQGAIVALDRVTDLPLELTPYQVRGRCTCLLCREWCWLGDQTHSVVNGGAAGPICLPCAREHCSLGDRIDHLHDSRRGR